MDKENMVISKIKRILSHEKKEQSATCLNRMELEGNMVSEVTQRKTNTVWYYLNMKSKKKAKQKRKMKSQRTDWWLPYPRDKG